MPTLVRAFGSQGKRALHILDKPRADEGHFGADSVSWRVLGHATVGLGAIRTSIVEMLHPPSSAALAEHSTYKTDPLGRAIRSATLISYLVFGDKAAAERAAARWYTIHEQINGVVPVTEKPYRALDLDNLLWIYMTGWHSFFISYHVYARPLSRADQDRFFAEAAYGAEMMGIPGRLLPDTRAKVGKYLREMRHELCLTEEAREVIDTFMRPGASPPILLVGNPFLRIATYAAVATLPRDLRVLARVDNPRILDLALRPLVLAAANAVSLSVPRQALALAAPEAWAMTEQARRWAREHPRASVPVVADPAASGPAVARAA